MPDIRGRIVEENWLPAVSLSVETTTAGSSTNEVQRVGFGDTTALTGGTFTLTFGAETTDPLAFDADASTVESALVALTSIGSGNVSVAKTENTSTAQEWELTFIGALAGANQSQTTITGTSVTHTGTLTDVQATDTQGASVDEVQVITLENAETGTFTLSFDSETTDALAFDASAETVESALADLSSIGSGNVSVSGSAGGPWTVTFGGTLAGTNVETVTGDQSNLASTTILRSFEFAFDEANQLLSAVDPASSFAFVYDGLGRVTEETLGITGLTPEIVLAKTWDVMGNRLSLAATIGEDTDFENSYTFDALNRMTQVVQAGQSGGNAVATKRIDMGYTALGQFATLDRYQSAGTSEFVATTTYGYDNANRLLSLYHEQGETVLAGYTFVQDALGRITEIDSETDGLSTFTYDATSQLTVADHTGQADESRDWDANGNPEGAAFDVGANNRLLEDALFLYEQDAEGNTTKRTTKATGDHIVFEWDHRNRLAKASFYDSEDTLLQTIDYAYDVSNRWIRRTLDEDGPGGASAVDSFFAGYDGLDATLQFEGPAAADLSNRYVWGAQVDQLLANESVESLVAEGDTLWPFLDQLGTAKDLGTYNPSTNETSIANHRVYNAFGSLTSETNSSVILVFSFTGKPLDAAIGLIQYVHRWYDPNTGRFASEDPIGFSAGDTNVVRYVGNNVANLTDPFGLETPGHSYLLADGTDVPVTLSDSEISRRYFRKVFGLFTPSDWRELRDRRYVYELERAKEEACSYEEWKVMRKALDRRFDDEVRDSIIGGSILAQELGWSFPHESKFVDRAIWDTSSEWAPRLAAVFEMVDAREAQREPWRRLSRDGDLIWGVGMMMHADMMQRHGPLMGASANPSATMNGATRFHLTRGFPGAQRSRGVFPADPNDFSRMLGMSPCKVGKTKDGTVRMTWQPNANTRIRFESHPDGLKPGAPGFNPRHHGEHYHIEIKPDGMSWNRAESSGSVTKLKPEGYTPGSGTGFIPGERFPGQ